MAEKQYKLHCPQCQALAVNGVATHETRCPNSERRWITRSRGLTQPMMIPEGEDLPAWAYKD